VASGQGEEGNGGCGGSGVGCWGRWRMLEDVFVGGRQNWEDGGGWMFVGGRQNWEQG